jgi:hypothetical protein
MKADTYKTQDVIMAYLLPKDGGKYEWSNGGILIAGAEPTKLNKKPAPMPICQPGISCQVSRD